MKRQNTGSQLIPTEYDEGVALTEYLELLKNKGDVIVFSKTAQETWTRSWSQKTRNKRSGVRPGVPDYIVVTKDRVLFIELKRIKKSVIRGNQVEWLEAVRGKKCEAMVAYGADEAIEYIKMLNQLLNKGRTVCPKQ